MKELSIIFLSNPNAAAKQYSVSFKTIYLTLGLLTTGFLVVFGVYFSQYQLVLRQQKTIEKQEKKRDLLKQHIDNFAEREHRINELEIYVNELKKTAVDSEFSLKKHVSLYQASTDKLMELNNYLAEMLHINLPKMEAKVESPKETVQILEKVQNNFGVLEKSLRDFHNRKTTIQEQEEQIRELQSRINSTDQELSEHYKNIRTKEEAIQRLAKRIKQVTGISVDAEEPKIVRQNGTQRRGGPSKARFLEEDDATSNTNIITPTNIDYLKETDAAYTNVVKSFEELITSIEKDAHYWQRTPTVKPVHKNIFSDSYGFRTDPFTGRRDFHAGLDFIADIGTSLYAPAEGVIVKAHREGAYGLFIEIEHGEGIYRPGKQRVSYITRYGHLSKLLVQVGQKVKRGDEIARTGNTGRSTGPHLHYEIVVNGKNVNPLELLNMFASMNKG